MRIIYPFIIAVLAVFVFTACSSLQRVESDAYCFSKLSKEEIKKYNNNTPEIIIKKRDGNTYNLRNWTLDSANSFIEGNGVCLNYAMDTIQSGYLYVDLLPNDLITATKREYSKNGICCAIVGIEALVGLVYLFIYTGLELITSDDD